MIKHKSYDNMVCYPTVTGSKVFIIENRNSSPSHSSAISSSGSRSDSNEIAHASVMTLAFPTEALVWRRDLRRVVRCQSIGIIDGSFWLISVSLLQGRLWVCPIWLIWRAKRFFLSMKFFRNRILFIYFEN